MTKNLLDIPTEELLEKFGKSKHVPTLQISWLNNNKYKKT
jgi:hypothetical protein